MEEMGENGKDPIVELLNCAGTKNSDNFTDNSLHLLHSDNLMIILYIYYIIHYPDYKILSI